MQKAYVCYDMGGTSIKTGIITKDGEMLASSKIETGASFEECMNNMITYLDNQKTLYDVQGVGISAPGAVDSQSGYIDGNSALKFIHGPNWKDEWKQRTGFDIGIENDANCAALSELHFGEAKDMKNFIYIVIGSGIGGAVVVDGEIQKGKHLHGGEFGYIFLPHTENDTLMNWSELAATVPTVKKYNAMHPESPKTGEEIFDLADNYDRDALSVVEKFYHYNAIGIHNVQFVNDPDLILIGGGISRREGFEEKINEQVEYICSLHKNVPRPTVKIGKFLDDANLYGALANLLYH